MACAALFLVSAASTARAQSLTLAWDPIPEVAAVGYVVYVGTAPGSYSETHDVGSQTTFTYPGVSTGLPLYFSVAAYASSGSLGAKSPELFFLGGRLVVGGASQTQRSNASASASTELAASASSSDCLGDSCRGAQEVVSVAGAITELLALEPGRLAFVEGGRHVRILTPQGLAEQSALTVAADDQIVAIASAPAFSANHTVYVAVMTTGARGTRELTLVRYRELANVLGEGATIVSGLPVPLAGEVRLAVDLAGRVSVAMPSQLQSSGSDAQVYAGRLLRYERDGAVPTSQDSPVVATGAALPDGLAWNGWTNELWFTGHQPSGEVVSNALALSESGASPIVRALKVGAADDEYAITSLALQTSSATDPAGVIVDNAGTVSLVDATGRLMSVVPAVTSDGSFVPVLAALDGNQQLFVAGGAAGSPATRIVRLPVPALAVH